MLSNSIELNNNSFSSVSAKASQNNNHQENSASGNPAEKVTISEEALKLSDRSAKIQQDAKDIYNNWVDNNFILAVPNANPRFSEHNQALLERLEVQKEIIENKVNGQAVNGANPEIATELQNQLSSLKGKIFMLQSYGEKEEFSQLSLADRLDSWSLAFTKLGDHLKQNESSGAQDSAEELHRQVQQKLTSFGETTQTNKSENTALDSNLKDLPSSYEDPSKLTDLTISKMLDQYLS